MPQIKPEIWKQKPDFMSRAEQLTPEEMRTAAMQLSPVGLELCAAGFFLTMTKLNYTPEQIAKALEES